MKKEHGWADPSGFITRIYVEESCRQNPYTKEIIERAKLPVTVVPDREPPNDLAEDFARNLSRGKKQLFLCENRGDFFKACPGTREYKCCDYQVLSVGSNCPIDCVYCILQAYLNSPWIQFYVNIDKMFQELDSAIDTSKDSFFRIGTGEFTDSLAIDRLTRLSEPLVRYMATKQNGVLELKTKSAVIDTLRDLPHNRKTIVSWSLNGKEIMEKWELRSASLEQRLQAAAQCADWGYGLGFHFDPIIEYPGWEDDYLKTIRRLFQVVDPKSIVWISLGALRYIPSLKQIGMKRFPSSRIFSGEFILGLDGKSRYFRPNRVELYKKVCDQIGRHLSSNSCLYFCMESDEIWQEVFGFTPEERGGLGAMLDLATKATLGETKA